MEAARSKNRRELSSTNNNNDNRSLRFSLRFGGGFGQGEKPGGVLGGGDAPICYTCGLSKHIAANCPKK
jgi:hypothetical protein